MGGQGYLSYRGAWRGVPPFLPFLLIYLEVVVWDAKYWAWGPFRRKADWEGEEGKSPQAHTTSTGPREQLWKQQLLFIACQCDSDHRYTGKCAPESGECECKPAFQGAKDCTACADGYYDYPECKPCDCYANGTMWAKFYFTINGWLTRWLGC